MFTVTAKVFFLKMFKSRSKSRNNTYEFNHTIECAILKIFKRLFSLSKYSFLISKWIFYQQEIKHLNLLEKYLILLQEKVN